jgi:UDP-glucose 4-epimerase
VAAGRRVLITGIAGQLQGLVAQALEQRDDVTAIVGVDVREPQHELARTEFVRADLRNPVVGRTLDTADIDTVLHLSLATSSPDGRSRAQVKERNVIGAMQLFAACQKAPQVQRVVLKSTTAVYGSDYADPARFGEEGGPRSPTRTGVGKDAVEVEGYLRTLGRQRKDVDVTILRFANLLGPRVDSSFHSLFTLPVVPTVLGFDPRLQFCHEDDAVGVLEHVATDGTPGLYNVAGEGVLYLSQCVRLAGRVAAPVPLPLVSAVAGLIRRSGRADLPPDQLRFLQYGRVVDTTRLRERLGYVPRYTSREAFEDFVEQRQIHGLIDREDVARWERELGAFLRASPQWPTATRREQVRP